MSKGKVGIVFIGGCLAEEEFEISSRLATEHLVQPTGLWFKSTEDGGAAIMKGGSLDANWHSFGQHVYEKGKKNSLGLIEYKHVKSEIIDRCSAKTKAGTQCMKPRYKDFSKCVTHKPKN